jgi:hypothetical protein
VIKWNDVAENMIVIDQHCKICQKNGIFFFCATRKKKEKDNKNII